ncbi:UPF0481 protein-like [Iris pallida]|uniref:UPF0481 protein-like n=1 Tax=Iris pallida TaxID=29817 RepID=A0AAX6ECA1_IRIPA|nr:UPF0481 protein-like [Iris pallida]
MASAGSGVVIDIDLLDQQWSSIDLLDQQWLSSLRKRVAGTGLRSRPREEPRTICRVPLHLREGDPVAYEPRIISFGPFCRDNPAVKPMEELKLRYVRRLLRRNPNAALEDYVNLIRGLEVRLRACYSEDIAMDSNKFVEMMLLDGCFFVELLLMISSGHCHGYEEEEEEADPVLTTPWALILINFDMLMLENQIPFFIIDGVFKLATFRRSCPGSLTDLLLRFFDALLPCERTSSPPPEDTFYHVLHFVHSRIVHFESKHEITMVKPPAAPIYLVLRQIRRRLSNIYGRVASSARGFWPPTRVRNEPSGSSPLTPESVPCATMLKEAGVKFREKKAESFLEVAFHDDGTMEIPKLLLYDGTNSLFRNLIAFEQCFPKAGTDVATYAVFMDCLVDSGEDVALLHRRGCLMNGLGDDEEAARLFNRLCKGVVVDYDSCYLASLFKDVKKHCDTRWYKYRARLMRDYFSNPWAFLSLLGALIIIHLTVVQTSFAILAYFNPLPTS